MQLLSITTNSMTYLMWPPKWKPPSFQRPPLLKNTQFGVRLPTEQVHQEQGGKQISAMGP